LIKQSHQKKDKRPENRDSQRVLDQEPIPTYQRLILDDSLLSELMSILGEPLHEPKITVISKPAPVAPIAIPKQTKTEILPFTIAQPNKQNLSREDRERQKQFDFFATLGFLPEEIFHLFSLMTRPLTNDELFLSLLQYLCHPNEPLLLQHSGQSSERRGSPSNAELDSELEILESIYGTLSDYSPSSTSLSCPKSLGLISTQLSLFGLVPITRIELLALDLDGVHVLRMVLFLTNSSQYPQDEARLYGWVIPQQPNGDSPGLVMKPISAATCRHISLETIRTTRERQRETQAPVLFDFIQNILSDCSVDHPPLPLPVPSPSTNTTQPPREGLNMKAAKTTAPKSQPAPLPLETASESPSNIPPALIKPSTRIMEGPEYREAYLQALNMGLKGEEARLQVRPTLTLSLDWP
jgi:hypothetical protein